MTEGVCAKTNCRENSSGEPCAGAALTCTTPLVAPLPERAVAFSCSGVLCCACPRRVCSNYSGTSPALFERDTWPQTDDKHRAKHRSQHRCGDHRRIVMPSVQPRLQDDTLFESDACHELARNVAKDTANDHPKPQTVTGFRIGYLRAAWAPGHSRRLRQSAAERRSPQNSRPTSPASPSSPPHASHDRSRTTSGPKWTLLSFRVEADRRDYRGCARRRGRVCGHARDEFGRIRPDGGKARIRWRGPPSGGTFGQLRMLHSRLSRTSARARPTRPNNQHGPKRARANRCATAAPKRGPGHERST